MRRRLGHRHVEGGARSLCALGPDAAAAARVVVVFLYYVAAQYEAEAVPALGLDGALQGKLFPKKRLPIGGKAREIRVVTGLKEEGRRMVFQKPELRLQFEVSRVDEAKVVDSDAFPVDLICGLVKLLPEASGREGGKMTSGRKTHDAHGVFLMPNLSA